MKTILTQAILVSGMLLLPSGVALARGGETETHRSNDPLVPSITVPILQEAHGAQTRGRDHAEDDSARATSSASSTHKGGYWSNPDNAEDIRGEGEEMHHNATSTATTSKHRGESNENHGGSGRSTKIQNFLSWIFGMPESTTVGDLKAILQASSTVGSSTRENAEGLGFIARLLGFFRHDN
jgi:hypothetical protein